MVVSDRRSRVCLNVEIGRLIQFLVTLSYGSDIMRQCIELCRKS